MTVGAGELPIKIVVFDNGKLGFIDIEQKTAGIEPIYTDLKNPDFGKVAEAMGLWGTTVAKAGELEAAIMAWLAQPGPALAGRQGQSDAAGHAPLCPRAPAVGMAVYTAKAMLHGRATMSGRWLKRTSDRQRENRTELMMPPNTPVEDAEHLLDGHAGELAAANLIR